MSRQALYSVHRSIDDTPLDNFGSFKPGRSGALSRGSVSPDARRRMRAFASFRDAAPRDSGTARGGVVDSSGAGAGAGAGAGPGPGPGTAQRRRGARPRRLSVDTGFCASRRDVMRGLRGDALVQRMGAVGAVAARGPRVARTFPTGTDVCLVRFKFGARTVVVRPLSLSPFCITCIAPPLVLDEAGAGASPQLHVALSFNGSEFEQPFAVGVAGVASGESFYHHRTLLHGLRPMPSLLDQFPEVDVEGAASPLDNSLSSVQEFEAVTSHHPVCYRRPTVTNLSTTSGSVRGGLVVTASGAHLHSVEPHRYTAVSAVHLPLITHTLACCCSGCARL